MYIVRCTVYTWASICRTLYITVYCTNIYTLNIHIQYNVLYSILGAPYVGLFILYIYIAYTYILEPPYARLTAGRKGLGCKYPCKKGERDNFALEHKLEN